jgi:tetratricopeptide (TPR) repeat protein
MPLRRTLAAALVTAACVFVGGCDEFNSRRKINEGNKAFKDGRFEEAVAMFESALADRDLDVGHYNLGIAYVKLFMPGVQNPRNAEYADKAAMHLARWLEKNPKDNDIRKLMTSVWVDSGDFEKAIKYWENEHQQAPTNRDVLAQLASINLKAASNPDWEKSRPYWDATIKWILMDADIAPTPEGKLTAYIGVGRVGWATLSPKEKVLGLERIRVADTAIAAMQKGLALDPKNIEILGLMGAIYNFRALGHGASWAAAIDRASAQDHSQRQRVLMEEKKKQAAENPTTPGPQTPAEKTGS